jgi:hypothetical protein
MSRNALARPWIRSRSGGFALFCGICWSEMTAHVKITRMTAADGPTAASLKSRVAVGCTHVPKKPLEKLANNTRLRVSSEHIYIYTVHYRPVRRASRAHCQRLPGSTQANKETVGYMQAAAAAHHYGHQKRCVVCLHGGGPCHVGMSHGEGYSSSRSVIHI